MPHSGTLQKSSSSNTVNIVAVNTDQTRTAGDALPSSVPASTNRRKRCGKCIIVSCINKVIKLIAALLSLINVLWKK
jgi:hypothetical protein